MKRKSIFLFIEISLNFKESKKSLKVNFKENFDKQLYKDHPNNIQNINTVIRIRVKGCNWI